MNFILIIFSIASAINTRKAYDNRNLGIHFIEPSLFEKVTWELEVGELKTTLEKFWIQENLDIHAYAERRILVKQALECLIVERLMWQFSRETEPTQADIAIKTCSEILVTSELIYDRSVNVYCQYTRPQKLTSFQKQRLFELESDIHKLRLFLLPLFYSPVLKQEYTLEVERCLITASLFRAYLSRHRFPFSPEIIKINALLLVVETVAKWTLGRPLNGREDDNLQLAFLHSMKISTLKVLLIAQSITGEITGETSLLTEALAIEGEFLTAKFFFLYFPSPPLDNSTRSIVSLFNFHSEPMLLWMFEEVYTDLYKILREFRIKNYYVPQYLPREIPASEKTDVQIRMGKLILLRLEQIVYSMCIYFEICSPCYRENKLDVTRKEAENLLGEFDAWHLEHTMFPKVMALYNYIISIA